MSSFQEFLRTLQSYNIPDLMKRGSIRTFIKEFPDSKVNYWLSVFLFDKEINLRAGALTFFTLSGIVPMCVFFLWFADFLMADISVSRMTTLMFPDVGESLETLSLFPRLRARQLLSSFAGWLAVALIIFYLHAFFSNIQYAFNYIWQSEDRTKKFWLGLKFNLDMTVVLFIIIMIFSFLFNLCHLRLLQYLVSSLLIFICVFLSFTVLPYDKKPLKKPAAITSLFVTAALLLWSWLIPVVGNQLSEFQFDGIDVLLILFWLYWAWFIVLSGARVCAFMSNRGIDYMRNEVSELAQNYRQFLSILIASYVFQNSGRHRDGSHGLSFDAIHKKMFRDAAYLPMSLLDSIIKELMSKGVLQKCDEKNEFFYEPSADIDEKNYTVGDLLFALTFAGGYDLKYQYQKINPKLESELSTSYMAMFSREETRLMDIPLDISLDEILSSKERMTDVSKKKEYERVKSSILRKIAGKLNIQ